MSDEHEQALRRIRRALYDDTGDLRPYISFKAVADYETDGTGPNAEQMLMDDIDIVLRALRTPPAPSDERPANTSGADDGGIPEGLSDLQDEIKRAKHAMAQRHHLSDPVFRTTGRSDTDRFLDVVERYHVLNEKWLAAEAEVSRLRAALEEKEQEHAAALASAVRTELATVFEIIDVYHSALPKGFLETINAQVMPRYNATSTPEAQQ